MCVCVLNLCHCVNWSSFSSQYSIRVCVRERESECVRQRSGPDCCVCEREREGVCEVEERLRLLCV